MDKKRKLKKFEVRKEEIINLNDYEMNTLKGGSTQGCAAVSAVTAVTALTVATYGYGQGQSWWACPPPPPPPQPSQNWIWIGEERVCQISEVVIDGLYTGGN